MKKSLKVEFTEDVRTLMNTLIKPYIKRESTATKRCCWTEILARSKIIHYVKHSLVEKGVPGNTFRLFIGYFW